MATDLGACAHVAHLVGGLLGVSQQMRAFSVSPETFCNPLPSFRLNAFSTLILHHVWFNREDRGADKGALTLPRGCCGRVHLRPCPALCQLTGPLEAGSTWTALQHPGLEAAPAGDPVGKRGWASQAGLPWALRWSHILCLCVCPLSAAACASPLALLQT